jgi:hypothetical protein
LEHVKSKISEFVSDFLEDLDRKKEREILFQQQVVNDQRSRESSVKLLDESLRKVLDPVSFRFLRSLVIVDSFTLIERMERSSNYSRCTHYWYRSERPNEDR